MEILETIQDNNDVLRDIFPPCMPANWSHTYSRTISDSADLGPSSIKTTVTQPPPQINVH